jgi:predicted urease superfamily metal-dependent hydrolase
MTLNSAPAWTFALHSPCALAEEQHRRRRNHDEDGADGIGDDAPDSKQVVAHHGDAAVEEVQAVEVEPRSILHGARGVDDGDDDDVSEAMETDYDDRSQPASVRAERVLAGDDDDEYYEDDLPHHFGRAWFGPWTPW